MKYNLFERLNKENEKHKLVIDDDHVYTINNSAAAIVTLQSISVAFNITLNYLLAVAFFAVVFFATVVFLLSAFLAFGASTFADLAFNSSAV